MRRFAVVSAVLSLAAVVAACGKPAAEGGDGASSAGPQPAELAPEQIKALQASLPAPYNAADIANGKMKFAICSACHTLTPGGPNMTGPNLHGIVGTKAAAVPNYNFSDALKAQTFSWDAAHLDAWIADPKAVAPGTKMTFAGVKDAKDRTDLVAYLMVATADAPKP
jgi:cytochrome c